VVLVGGPAATATPVTTKVLATTASATPTSASATSTPAGTSSQPTLSPFARIGSTPASTPVEAKPASQPIAASTPTSVATSALVPVPSLLGLAATQAQALVTREGLTNTYVNYQGPDSVPAAALQA